MKAAIFKGKQNIEIKEIPKPVVGENDVLIKVMLCGICGTDIHIYEGAEGAAKTTPTTIIGHEFSGIVKEIGSKVTSVTVGDRVSIDPNNTCGMCKNCKSGVAHFCENMIGYGTTADGGFAQYCVVHNKQVYNIGDMSFEEGAMAEPVACCLHGIDLCNIQPGSNVLIIGGGTIGLIILQLIKNSGAAKILLSEPVLEKRQTAHTLGADILIDPSNDKIHDVLQNNNVKNIDVVIECVGHKSTMLQAIAHAGITSTVMLFGLGNPSDEIAIQPFNLFKKEITVKSSFINPYTQQRAINILNSEKININALIGKIISLEDLAKVLALPALRSNGKIFVNPWL